MEVKTLEARMRVFVIKRFIDTKHYSRPVYVVAAYNLATGQESWRGCSFNDWEGAEEQERRQRWAGGSDALYLALEESESEGDLPS